MDAGVWNGEDCDVITCVSPQALQIGEEIEVAVLSVEGGRVRLGITAPGRRLMTIDPVPLPTEPPDDQPFGLGYGLRYGLRWPKEHGG